MSISKGDNLPDTFDDVEPAAPPPRYVHIVTCQAIDLVVVFSNEAAAIARAVSLLTQHDPRANPVEIAARLHHELRERSDRTALYTVGSNQSKRSVRVKRHAVLTK